MAYYTLVSKINASKYGIEFGDYDLNTVRDELADMVYCGYVKRKDCKIIETKTARQSEIDLELIKLNAK